VRDDPSTKRGIDILNEADCQVNTRAGPPLWNEQGEVSGRQNSSGRHLELLDTDLVGGIHSDGGFRGRDPLIFRQQFD
jgi:hypothetical protein